VKVDLVQTISKRWRPGSPLCWANPGVTDAHTRQDFDADPVPTCQRSNDLGHSFAHIPALTSLWGKNTTTHPACLNASTALGSSEGHRPSFNARVTLVTCRPYRCALTLPTALNRRTGVFTGPRSFTIWHLANLPWFFGSYFVHRTSYLRAKLLILRMMPLMH